VTRLNRRTLAILAAGFAAVVLGATLWSLQPVRHRGEDGTDELVYNVDRVARSEGLDRLPADYSELAPGVPGLGPPLRGDLGPAIVKSRRPVTASSAPPGEDPLTAERDALRKEAEAAATSPVFFRTGDRRTGAVPVGPGPAASEPGLAVFDPQVAGPGSTAAQPVDSALQGRRDLNGAGENRSPADLQPPASPYQVLAGTVISGALVTGIRSDLPGDAIATVTVPVYDTATGRYLLIPQGSRILGQYDSEVRYGQRRVQVVWNRIVLPDTSSLALDGLAGTDPSGYAGLEDGVDWHWDRILAGAALTTLLGVGAELAAPGNRDGDRVIVAGRGGLQDSVNQVGQEMTRRNIDLQPTLTVRPGLPVRIVVNRDLMLRPYRPMFLKRGTPR
jgi:type IV secretion system protein VirB10